MSSKLYCPEDYFESKEAILNGIASRGAEGMDVQRQLVANNTRNGGEGILRARYGKMTTPIHLNMVIDSLKNTFGANPAGSVVSKQVENVVWANPDAWGETNRMAIKNMGVAIGEPTIYELDEAPQALLDLARNGVELLSPILVLAYGFETNYWGNNRDVLSGAIYHVALSWLEWNPSPGNIHYGEKVNTERVWSGDSARLVGQVARINVRRSQLAHALEYSARTNPYRGGLAGL